jgi:hypothetical protein
MISATMITLLGTIATGGPTLSTDAEGGDECRFVLQVSGMPIPVATSSAHARWVAATVNSATVVQVEGLWRADGSSQVLQAWCVDPVPHAAEVP